MLLERKRSESCVEEARQRDSALDLLHQADDPIDLDKEGDLDDTGLTRA